MLGEHLREEQGSKEASTQTDQLPNEAGLPSPFRTQASAQTPHQRAHSVLQSQPRVCPFMPSGYAEARCCILDIMYVGVLPVETGASRLGSPT